ncbi:unnamed protein product [Clonostachys solani]|uniref:Centromere protein H C-terminal domain-containing protein n=1 Tax=Clonostachys solani TaxID=160281 RepID=A0A9N9Z6B3_9HYPO|nr:unnamed protein product [Clonostachys solani]
MATVLEGEVNQAPLPLSADEERALALYDKLRELQLEIAIINAQHKAQDGGFIMARRTTRQENMLMTETDASSGEMTAEETDEARNQLLDTRARYMLRNSVVEAVLSANPILKAVHNGTDASPVERDLLSYVEKRDEASIAVAKFALERGELRDKATKAQSKLLARAGHNAELASKLLELVARIDEKKGQQDDSAAQEALREFEGALAASRRRWRVIKGVTSGLIVGSGIDWARDDRLRDIVLDPEDDD